MRPFRKGVEMKVTCDKCGGEMLMSWVNQLGEEESHIKFTCKDCGYYEYLT